MAKPSPDRDNGENNDTRRSQINSYMRYTGMAFQMGATILVGVLIGQYLDGRFETEKPYFTMVLSIIFTAAAIYLAIKDFLNNEK